MTSSHAPLRGTTVAIVAAAMLNMPAHSAPKRPEPAPTAEQVTPAKTSATSKKKSKKPVAAPATETVRARKSPPAAKAKPAHGVPAKPEPKTPPAIEPVPEKKGFFKKLFGRNAKPAAAVEPELAKVKIVKPAPVKAVKPSMPADKLTTSAEEEPKKKRSFLGIFRRARADSRDEEPAVSAVPDDYKIERPDDWNERRVVKDDEIALYEYGPSQTNGPDARLARGTVVKVKGVQKGWALVEAASGRTGYMDASALRAAELGDFKDPVRVIPAMASVRTPENWAPLAPPPDLPEQPGPSGSDAALLLLPPLEPPPAKP